MVWYGDVCVGVEVMDGVVVLELQSYSSQLTILSHLGDALCVGCNVRFDEQQLCGYLTLLEGVEKSVGISRQSVEVVGGLRGGMTCFPRFVDGVWVDGCLLVSLFLGDKRGERIFISTLRDDAADAQQVAYVRTVFLLSEFRHYVTWIRSLVDSLEIYRNYYLQNPDDCLVEDTVILASSSSEV